MFLVVHGGLDAMETRLEPFRSRRQKRRAGWQGFCGSNSGGERAKGGGEIQSHSISRQLKTNNSYLVVWKGMEDRPYGHD